MPGLRKPINFHVSSLTGSSQVHALAPSLFYIAFGLCILIQFPVSAQFPLTFSVYALLLPSAALYAFYYPYLWRDILKHPVIRLFGLLFIYIVVHALVLSPDKEGIGKTVLNTLMTGMFFLCSVAFFTFTPELSLQRFLKLMAGTAAICAIISIAFYSLTYAQDIDKGLAPIGRAHHEILGALSYGMAGLVSLYLYSCATLRPQKIQYLMAVAVITLMVLLTRSRTPIVVYLLCMAAGYHIYFRATHKLLLAFAGGILLLGSAVLFSRAAHDYLSHSLKVVVEKKDGSRFELWQATWDKIREHPWVGSGMRAMLEGHVAYSPHNIYLATAYYIGIPAALLFIGLVLACARQAVRLLRLGEGVPMLAALMFFLGTLSALTEHGQLVKTPGPLWLIFWMPIGFVLAQSIRAGGNKK